MSTIKFLVWAVALAATLALSVAGRAQTNAASKKLLVVTVAKGWGHSSRPTGVKVVTELGQKSGAFTVDTATSDADLAAKMTPDALKNYDGVMFLSTTGDLPLPDKMAFLSWIKSGKGFIGAHSATDTFHGAGNTVDPYIDMIGGEFVSHIELPVTITTMDPNHPATRDLPKTWPLTDEIYFHKNFSRDKVHMLLCLEIDPRNGQPGFIPISWCKKYGQGNVFFTALGHPDEVWLNTDFQKHLLGGIKWALGLVPGDTTPQAAISN